MLVEGQPVMALFRPRPGASRRCSMGWVRWAVAMSAWITDVAMVLPGGGYRHRSGQDVRIPGLLDSGGGTGFWERMREIWVCRSPADPKFVRNLTFNCNSVVVQS